MGLIGDFQRLGKVLLVIVVVGIVGFYLTERFWISRKVEEADPERLQELEHAASEKLQDLKRGDSGTHSVQTSTAQRSEEARERRRLKVIADCQLPIADLQWVNEIVNLRPAILFQQSAIGNRQLAMIIESSAPPRVDLAGGTIDIWPLYLFHPGATTVNFALSLYARCRIETRDDGRIILESRDLKVSFETDALCD